MILLIMGVCGSGKTTTGEMLADQLNWSFADADEFHSEANKSKMSQGHPLTDEDRIPWLCTIHTYIKQLCEHKQSGIVTCSALKKLYRTILTTGRKTDTCGPNHNNDKTTTKETNEIPLSNVQNCDKCSDNPFNIAENLNLESHDQKTSHDKSADSRLDIRFIHLTGSTKVLQDRLDHRQGHFMPSLLLSSQLETLEPLTEAEPGLVVDIDKPQIEIIQEIIQKLI